MVEDPETTEEIFLKVLPTVVDVDLDVPCRHCSSFTPGVYPYLPLVFPNFSLSHKFQGPSVRIDKIQTPTVPCVRFPTVFTTTATRRSGAVVSESFLDL